MIKKLSKEDGRLLIDCWTLLETFLIDYFMLIKSREDSFLRVLFYAFCKTLVYF